LRYLHPHIFSGMLVAMYLLRQKMGTVVRFAKYELSKRGIP